VSTAGDFTLLTYNVAGLPQEISKVHPQRHIPLISPLLDAYDVVLTQEDFDWWHPSLDATDFTNYHSRLREAAGHPHRSGRWPGAAAAGIDPAVRSEPMVGDGLGVLSRLPFAEGPVVAWHDCFGGFDTSDGGDGDCLAGKGFRSVTVTLAPDAEVDVYVFHGEAGGTDRDRQLRDDDFVQLAGHVAAHSADRAVIVGGDSNLHTASEPAAGRVWAAFLDRTGLTDACTVCGCGETDSIDKVAFRSGGGVALTATSVTFPRERFRDPDDCGDLSDHPPLVVGFHWTSG
jgi:hypothetical protein